MVALQNPKQEFFADLNGDGKDDIILNKRNGQSLEFWVYELSGSSFKYVNHFMISNLNSDDIEIDFFNSNIN